MKENDCWGDFGYLWDVNDIPDGLGTEGERLMEVKDYADELIEEDILDDEYKFIDEDFEIDDRYEEYFDESGFDFECWMMDMDELIQNLKAEGADEVEVIIGYRFRNQHLLKQAFIRKSYKVLKDLKGCNEELEFYGDSVLNYAVTREMFDCLSEFKDGDSDNPFVSFHNEGELTKIRQSFVNKEYLAQRCRELGLDKYILYGNEEESESSLEDTIEAIVGAVAIDSDFDETTISDVVDRLVNVQLDNPSKLLSKSYYDTLNSWHQRHFGIIPEYSIIHNKGLYSCMVHYFKPNGEKGYYTYENCKTRSKAREMAAEMVVRTLQLEGLWINIKDSGIVPCLEDSINQLQELYQKKYLEHKAEYEYRQFGKDWQVKCICEGYTGAALDANKTKAKKKASYIMLRKLFLIA